MSARNCSFCQWRAQVEVPKFRKLLADRIEAKIKEVCVRFSSEGIPFIHLRCVPRELFLDFGTMNPSIVPVHYLYLLNMHQFIPLRHISRAAVTNYIVARLNPTFQGRTSLLTSSSAVLLFQDTSDVTRHDNRQPSPERESRDNAMSIRSGGSHSDSHSSAPVSSIQGSRCISHQSASAISSKCYLRAMTPGQSALRGLERPHMAPRRGK